MYACILISQSKSVKLFWWRCPASTLILHSRIPGHCYQRSLWYPANQTCSTKATISPYLWIPKNWTVLILSFSLCVINYTPFYVFFPPLRYVLRSQPQCPHLLLTSARQTFKFQVEHLPKQTLLMSFAFFPHIFCSAACWDLCRCAQAYWY